MKGTTIIFDDKRLPCVFIDSHEGQDVFRNLLADPMPQAPRRILSTAYDILAEVIRNAIHNDVDKNTIYLLLSDLRAIKIALCVILRGHRVIAIEVDKEI